MIFSVSPPVQTISQVQWL